MTVLFPNVEKCIACYEAMVRPGDVKMKLAARDELALMLELYKAAIEDRRGLRFSNALAAIEKVSGQ